MKIEKRDKKTAEEIKKSILVELNKGPQTAQDIAKGIKSNWKTVKDYLKKLIEENEVKEIPATEKVSYYKRTAGDTYFDLPISEEQRKKFRTLFYLIREGYKNNDKKINRTHLAKCAVDIIKENNFEELKDLPVVWYLYGALPQMCITLEETSEEYNFNEKEKIEEAIMIYVITNGDKSTSQLKKEQHEKYGRRLHCLMDELLEELDKEKLEKSKINELLNNFFVECPVDPKFPEIFDLTENVISIIDSPAFLSEDLTEYRKEILTTINALWNFIALYYLYKSKTEEENPMKEEILMNFYLGDALEDRKRVLEESILELRSKYLEILSKSGLLKIELSGEAKEVARIMEDLL